ncbi:MAG TPA: Crp/Fnr family transcriptional regulator [Burkholderiales bacterium]|nr:Crp/Fnr family transcriptional regulator [Burkholderiales bacterium]
MTPFPGPFLNVDEARLRELAPHGAVRTFPKNSVVLNEGDQTNSLYVIMAGRVKVYMTGEDGRELVVATLKAGEYFGELVLDGGPRAASVMTLEPSRFFVLPQSDVQGLLLGHPLFAQELIFKLIGKVRDLDVKVRDLALKDVYGRFVSFLESSAEEHAGERVVPEPLTQSDIAARIGGSREMVSRIVRDLTAGAYIAVESKRIRILKKLPAHW